MSKDKQQFWLNARSILDEAFKKISHNNEDEEKIRKIKPNNFVY